MAPPNTACRMNQGKTIQKFVASFHMQGFTDHKHEYICIAEISQLGILCFIYLKHCITSKIKGTSALHDMLYLMYIVSCLCSMA